MTNDEGSQNAQMTKEVERITFGIRVSSFLRASSFVIRHFAMGIDGFDFAHRAIYG